MGFVGIVYFGWNSGFENVCVQFFNDIASKSLASSGLVYNYDPSIVFAVGIIAEII